MARPEGFVILSRCCLVSMRLLINVLTSNLPKPVGVE